MFKPLLLSVSPIEYTMALEELDIEELLTSFVAKTVDKLSAVEDRY
jgi:hypothetical protein